MREGDVVDYLVLGHLCRDITPQGRVLGGTAAYASSVARTLGCRAAVVTSSAEGEDWPNEVPGVSIACRPAPQTTTFENVYAPEGRTQTLHARAETITLQDIPLAWRNAPIVHLGPVADEVDPVVFDALSSSLIGLTPQGWMRQWDENGRVQATYWRQAERYLPLAAAVIISEEDLLDDDMLDRYRRWSKILVLTRGSDGCSVFMNGEQQSFASPQVAEVNLTGAGDSFAAAYFVRLYQTRGNPWESARFANEVASASITAVSLPAKLKAIEEILN